MSFTLRTVSGFQYIEQTGTDTDISGLAPFTQYNIPPVTNLGFPLGWTGQKIYFLQRPLLILGSVTFDPSEESLVIGNDFENNPSAYNYALRVTGIGASLTVGVQQGTNPDGSPRYSQGVGIVIGRDFQQPLDPLGTVTREGMLIDDAGVLTVNGSEVQLASCLKVATDAGVCTFNGTRIVDLTTFNLGKQTIRNESPANILRLNDVEFDAKNIPQRFINLGGIDTFSGVFRNSFIQPHRAETGVASPSGTVTLENVVLQKNFNTYDFQLVGNSTTPSDNQAVELTNTDVGTGVRINYVAPNAINHLAIFQKIEIEVQDTAFQAIENCKVRIPTTDSGNRDNGSIGGDFIGNRDFSGSTYALYSDVTNPSGLTQEFKILTGRIYDDTLGSTVTEYDLYGKTQVIGEDRFDIQFISYLHNLAIQEVELKQSSAIGLTRILTLDSSITETDKTIVDTYTELETSQKLYDRSKAELYDSYSGESQTTLELSGDLIDCRDLDVVIDATASVFNLSGNTLTIKASNYTGDMVTTGTITLTNGAIFTGTRTDVNGTVLPPRDISITGISSGSRLRIFNTTTATEVYNDVVAGTTYTASYEEGVGYSIGDVIELRLAKIDKLEFTATVIASSTGWSTLISQQENQVYLDYGVDGSTVTGISWDSGNMEFDFNELDNVIEGPDIGAWYHYFITTSVGIAEAFGSFNWSQINKLTNLTSIYDITWDNIKSTPLQINNIWVEKDNGNTIISNSSNSIQINPPAVFVKETSTTGLTPEEATQLDELYKLQGLDASHPLNVTPTSRTVDDIEQQITGDGKTSTTVQRI